MISAWECFHFATLELVRSTPIKQRLVCAYRRHLALLTEEQVPAEARRPFALVMKSLCGVSPQQRGEEPVVASVRKMSSQEADDCAAAIVEIYSIISRHESSERGIAVVQLQPVDREEPYELPALFARN
jgi:hypothetical protein